MKSDASPRVIRPKVACDSIQNVTSVFGNTLKRIKTLEVTPNIGGAGPNDHRIRHSTDPSWPSLATATRPRAGRSTRYGISGAVHDIPAANWSKKANPCTFNGIPVYDAPILIADRSSMVTFAPDK